MITDIFAFRYNDRKIWQTYTSKEQRLIYQSFRLISEQIAPYYINGNVDEYGKSFWTDIHNKLSNELGVEHLSPSTYSFPIIQNGKQTTVSGINTMVHMCEAWIQKPLLESEDIDFYIKERLSLIEIALRKREEEIQKENENLPERIARAESGPTFSLGSHITFGDANSIKKANESRNIEFQNLVNELNTRFKQASCHLHYHNGLIQLSEDELLLSEVEQPFWHIVSDPIWKNVDTDIKEAIDRRDNNGRDPVWYAVCALESTIKIISDQKGWTHGKERGAHNFIENLASNSSNFIDAWEAKALKSIFSDIRNSFGHGPGSEERFQLTPQQTDLMIEQSMSWIKSLIKRL